MKRDAEKFNRFLTMSVVFHIALLILLVFSPSLFPVQSGSWGTETSSGDAIGVSITGSVSGMNLPSPAVVQPDAAANPSPGFYNTETAPPPPPPEDAEPIPETKAPVKTTPPPRPPARTPPPQPKPADDAPPTPDNAIPFGQGGRPALSYGQYQAGAGSLGIGFGDGAFGDRYGWYVQSITRRISNNWLKSLVDNGIRTAPRVYLTFVIERNGSVSGAQVAQSSGYPSLDRSALRAILASNPLPELPGDFRGSSVTVSFYFEYVR